MLSEHVGAWQTLDVHTLLWQSVDAEHALVSAHGEQLPPQSMSVSVPFLTVSAHVAAAQAFEVHTPL